MWGGVTMVMMTMMRMMVTFCDDGDDDDDNNYDDVCNDDDDDDADAGDDGLMTACLHSSGTPPRTKHHTHGQTYFSSNIPYMVWCALLGMDWTCHDSFGHHLGTLTHPPIHLDTHLPTHPPVLRRLSSTCPTQTPAAKT